MTCCMSHSWSGNRNQAVGLSPVPCPVRTPPSRRLMNCMRRTSWLIDCFTPWSQEHLEDAFGFAIALSELREERCGPGF